MIIAISGKKQHGKDTVGQIIQLLLTFPKINKNDVIKYLNNGGLDNAEIKIKKFAGYLKQITADLTGCTLEDMENEDKKNEVIYKSYHLEDLFVDCEIELQDPVKIMEIYCKKKEQYLVGNSQDEVAKKLILTEIDITRREIMLRIGTGVGRQINSNIWIDHLFRDYKTNEIGAWSGSSIDYSDCKFPTWIITDCRFINEAEKVKKRGGIIIRVNNPRVENNSNHISETELDDYKFDAVITNNHSISILIDRVRKVLKTKNLI